ncbi:radical SAM protein [Elusimicrobiota bacterium]
MKISFIRCPCIEPYYPPDIGLGYLSSFLHASGHEISLYDLNIEIFQIAEPGIRKKWGCKNTGIDELENIGKILAEDLAGISAEKIIKKDPEIIGFSVWESNKEFSINLARKIKKINKDVLIIFGGPEAYPYLSGNKLIRDEAVDLVIYGEAELTIKNIIEMLENNEELEFCPGCIIKNSGKIIDCGRGRMVKNLDDLPFPEWDYFNLELYEKKELFISFGRGCRNKCAYCGLTGTTPLYRYRSAESIISEINHQKKTRNIKKFFVADPELNSNISELGKICDLLIENESGIDWGGHAVVDPGMDLDMFVKMKNAGCSFLMVGIESASQDILSKMGKGHTVKDIEDFLFNCKQSGIKIIANFIIGFPGETEKDFEKTLRFIEKNQDYIDVIGSRSDCWIDPYSMVYRNAEDYGVSLSEDCRMDKSWVDKGCNHNNEEERKLKWQRFGEFVNKLNFEMHFSAHDEEYDKRNDIIDAIMLCKRENRISDAINLAQEALKEFVVDKFFYAITAEMLLEKDDMAAAEIYVDRTSLISPEYYFTNRIKGYYFLKQKKYEEAVNYLQKAVELSPNDYEKSFSYELLSKVYDQLGNLEKMIDNMRKASSCQPDNTYFKRILQSAEERADN